jgi:Flp pilus assembly protein TadG
MNDRHRPQRFTQLPRVALAQDARQERWTMRDDQRGAVMVEFAIAILPVLMVFFGTVQWCACAYVNLIVHHGAFVAARCNAVVHPQMPDSGPADDCQNGVNALLKDATKEKATVTLESPPAATAETVQTTTVTLDYKCTVPLGNVVACGGSKAMKMTATASFPNQGSSYQKIWY